MAKKKQSHSRAPSPRSDPSTSDPSLHRLLLSEPRRGQKVGPTTHHVLSLLDAGYTVREIAQDLDVTTQRVYAIIKREGREPPQGAMKRRKGKSDSEAPRPVRDDTEDDTDE